MGAALGSKRTKPCIPKVQAFRYFPAMDRKYEQLVHDLTRKRRELTHDIEKLLGDVGRLRDDVEAIDRVMTIFRPDTIPETIVPLQFRRHANWANRGTITRAIFDLLRESARPLTMPEITEHVMAARGVARDAITPTHKKTVYKALDQQRMRGRLLSRSNGRMLLWELMPPSANSPSIDETRSPPS